MNEGNIFLRQGLTDDGFPDFPGLQVAEEATVWQGFHPDLFEPGIEGKYCRSVPNFDPFVQAIFIVFQREPAGEPDAYGEYQRRLSGF